MCYTRQLIGAYAKNFRFIPQSITQIQQCKKDYSKRTFYKRLLQNGKMIVRSGKKDIPSARLYQETNRFAKKVNFLAGISWNRKTGIHFIVNKYSKISE